MEKDITLGLFNSPDPGNGKARVTLTEDSGKADMISAALAIRHANLPYSPVLHDKTPAIPYAEVEFQIEDSDEADNRPEHHPRNDEVSAEPGDGNSHI